MDYKLLPRSTKKKKKTAEYYRPRRSYKKIWDLFCLKKLLKAWLYKPFDSWNQSTCILAFLKRPTTSPEYLILENWIIYLHFAQSSNTPHLLNFSRCYFAKISIFVLYYTICDIRIDKNFVSRSHRILIYKFI